MVGSKKLQAFNKPWKVIETSLIEKQTTVFNLNRRVKDSQTRHRPVHHRN